GLYLNNPRPAPALASLIVGEVLVLGYHLKLLPSFGFLSAVPVIVGALLAYIFAHLFTGSSGIPKFTRRHALYWAVFALIFVLSQDYWNWGSSHDLLLGWPAWAWYFVMLSLVQVIVTAIMLRREASGRPARNR
ncbi:MAG: hypothetical protein JSW34_06005, partial [Candidatus Zixiibacteriota bacterium]